MIINVLILLTLVCVFIIFLYEFHKRGFKVVVSYIFPFGIFWILSYPVKAYLIWNHKVELLGYKEKFSEDILSISLLLSFGFFLSAYLGYASVNPAKIRSVSNVASKRLNFGRYANILLFFIVIFSLSFFYNVLGIFLATKERLDTITFFYGKGYIFSALGLLSIVYYGILAKLVVQSRITKDTKIDIKSKIIILFFLSLFVVYGVVMGTRRTLSIPFLVLIFTLLLIKPSRINLLLLLLLYMNIPLGGVLLQKVRYLSLQESLSLSYFLKYDVEFVTQIISSTFEGLDHVSRLLEITPLIDLLIGINPDIFLYNFLLKYIPRAIWDSKPQIYGSLEEQYYLYPWTFYEKIPSLSIPPGFIVDYIFIFGVLGGFFLSYLMGVYLKIMEFFAYRSTNVIAVFVSLYTYANIFNLLRSGSAFYGNVLFPLLVVVCILLLDKILKELLGAKSGYNGK